jgi:hypothetical protein
MSDLAPFVAATLRDKVVQDLMEENEAMQKQIRQFKSVEITGPGGSPVYSRAQFDESGYYCNDPVLWEVEFPETQDLSCPLSILEDIEVRLGGVLKAKFTGNSVFETFLDTDDRDYDHGKVVNFCFGGASSLWLTVRIDGWPRQSWQATIDQGFGSDELLSHLVDDVAIENPNKTVHFLDVNFVVTSVSGVIQSLNLDPTMEEDAERRIRDDEPYLFFFLKMMKEAGIERRSSRGRAILSALNDMGSEGPNSLIKAQMRSRTPEEFSAFVNDLIFRNGNDDGDEDSYMIDDEDE